MTTKRRRRFTADFKKRVALEALRGDPNGAGYRGQARGPSEPGGHLEAAGDRGVGRGVRPRRIARPVGARGDDPRPAREDRRVDDGTGFFSAGVAALSRPARRNLVDRAGALSIRRQCALLGISRSSVYYAPRGESAENLALMRRMDALSQPLLVDASPRDFPCAILVEILRGHLGQPRTGTGPRPLGGDDRLQVAGEALSHDAASFLLVIIAAATLLFAPPAGAARRPRVVPVTDACSRCRCPDCCCSWWSPAA